MAIALGAWVCGAWIWAYHANSIRVGVRLQVMPGCVEGSLGPPCCLGKHCGGPPGPAGDVERTLHASARQCYWGLLGQVSTHTGRRSMMRGDRQAGRAATSTLHMCCRVLLQQIGVVHPSRLRHHVAAMCTQGWVGTARPSGSRTWSCLPVVALFLAAAVGS
jgi:hypothetical protein